MLSYSHATKLVLGIKILSSCVINSIFSSLKIGNINYCQYTLKYITIVLQLSFRSGRSLNQLFQEGDVFFVSMACGRPQGRCSKTRISCGRLKWMIPYTFNTLKGNCYCNLLSHIFVYRPTKEEYLRLTSAITARFPNEYRVNQSC